MSIIDKKDPFVAVYDNQRKKVVHFRKSIYESMLQQRQLQNRFFLENELKDRLKVMNMIDNQFQTTQIPVETVSNDVSSTETVARRTRKPKENEVLIENE